MNIWKGALALSLGCASALLAATPPADPITLLQQTVDATQRAHEPFHASLSPSTRAARNSELEAAIHHAFRFLEDWQHQNGSWDRLENPPPMQIIHDPMTLMTDYDGPLKDQAENDTEEVADTCLSAEAMLLAINSGREAELSPKCLKAIDFLCKQINLWDGDTIYIQKRVFDPLHDPAPSTHDERYYNSTVDTFFALRFLTEARDHLDDAERKARVQNALDILLTKIIKSQDINGTWLDEANPMAHLHVHNDPAPHAQPGMKIGETPVYDAKHPNVVTHCVALSAINIAARNGLPVPLNTRYRAENYLRNIVEDPNFGHENPKIDIVRIVVVSAEYQTDETCRALLDAALKRQKEGASPPVTDEQIHVLQVHARQARHDLLHSAHLMLNANLLLTNGPALDALPDAMAALQLLSLDGDGSFAGAVQRMLLRRQRQDGHFPAEADSPFPTRGDSTFGTATALRILMIAANTPAPEPADTQP